jgi:O-antigen ligase
MGARTLTTGSAPPRGDTTPDAIHTPDTRSFKTAVLLATASVVALPFLRPSGAGNVAPIPDSLIVGTILATLYWVVSTRRPIHVPYGWAVALLVAGGCLAALANDRTWSAALTVGQDLFLLLWAAALAALASTPAVARVLLRAWALAATVWAALLIVGLILGIAALTGIAARTGPRVSFTLGDPNFAANYFVVSLLIVAATGYPRGLLRIASYGMLLVALVFTGSNGGFVTLAVALVIIVAPALVRSLGAAPALAAACLLGAGVAVVALTPASHVFDSVLNNQAQQQQNPLHQSVGRVDQSTQTRSVIFSETTGLYRDSSVLGIGPGATKDVLAQRQYPYVKMAHDDYVAAILERGLLGGLGLILLLGAVATRTRAAITTVGTVSVVHRPAALVAAVAAFAVAAGFYQVLHLRHLWALLGIVAGLALAGDR